MRASESELRRRIRKRNSAREDSSEADESVLDWQLAHQELPGSDSQVIVVDTETVVFDDLVHKILECDL